jgi:hypothetical protein
VIEIKLEFFREEREKGLDLAKKYLDADPTERKVKKLGILIYTKLFACRDILFEKKFPHRFSLELAFLFHAELPNMAGFARSKKNLTI